MALGLAISHLVRMAKRAGDRKVRNIIGWHRQGFRLFWTWKSRHGKPGRPTVAKEVRQLIRRMSRENPLWGGPKIHGELLKLGIEISESSVSKYLVGRKGSPPLANLENISAEPHKGHGFCRLLYGSHHSLPDPLCLPGPGTRTSSHRSLRGHCSSNGRVDGTATSRSISLGHSTPPFVTRSRSHLRARIRAASEGDGNRGSAVGSAVSLATGSGFILHSFSRCNRTCFCKQVRLLPFELARQIICGHLIEALVLIVVPMRPQQAFVAPSLNQA